MCEFNPFQIIHDILFPIDLMSFYNAYEKAVKENEKKYKYNNFEYSITNTQEILALIYKHSLIISYLLYEILNAKLNHFDSYMKYLVCVFFIFIGALLGVVISSIALRLFRKNALHSKMSSDN